MTAGPPIPRAAPIPPACLAVTRAAAAIPPSAIAPSAVAALRVLHRFRPAVAHPPRARLAPAPRARLPRLLPARPPPSRPLLAPRPAPPMAALPAAPALDLRALALLALLLYLLRRLLLLVVTDCDVRTYTARVNPADFRGKVAWVTGASSGIGRALAVRLAREGALLILSSRREDALAAVADALPCPPGNVHVLPLDLADLPAVEAAAAAAPRIFGRLDFVFNNAGVSTRASAAQLAPADVARVLQLNFFGPVALARACLPALRETPGGRATIVNTASIASIVHTPMRSSYCASKAALVSYFECLRLEEKHVRVVNVHPGSVRTAISHNAVGVDGKKHDKADPNIEAGLEPDRVADRMLAAISAGQPHAWIARPKELTAVRIAAAFPRLWAWIAARRAEPYRRSIENA